MTPAVHWAILRARSGMFRELNKMCEFDAVSNHRGTNKFLPLNCAPGSRVSEIVRPDRGR